jgi:hypothetical protein
MMLTIMVSIKTLELSDYKSCQNNGYISGRAAGQRHFSPWPGLRDLAALTTATKELQNKLLKTEAFPSEISESL